MTKFLKLFKGKYCRIKDKAFKTFVLGSISGYGCSDEAVILMLCCTLKLVLITMGIDHKISDEQIANAGPCHNKITNGEYMIAAGCVQESRHDMEINGVTTVSVSSDHGDKKGGHHLVKAFSYAAVDSTTGKRTIRRKIADVDYSDSTCDRSSSAIKRSAIRFFGPNTLIVIDTISGDAAVSLSRR
jgi:hypothetical protein